MEEKISVIVPVYNLEQWLPRCLDSILAQTHENLEIIAVDDGSKDGSADVLRDYAARDERVKAVFQKNAGVTAARLRGVAEATGAWIGFIDGDDEIEPDMYARLLRNAHDYGADISHCGYRRDFSDGRREYHYNSGELRCQDRLTGLRDLLEERLVEPGLCSKLFRAELFSGLEGKMDPSIKNNEDMLMNFYLFSGAESSVYEDVCPYHYILRESSASRRKLNDHRIYDPVRVREIILEQCGGELEGDARQALLRVLLYVYALLTVEPGREYEGHKKQIRGKLRAQKAGFPVLTKRNQILANLICYAPGLFHVVFLAYVKTVLKGHYE